MSKAVDEEEEDLAPAQAAMGGLVIGVSVGFVTGLLFAALLWWGFH